MKTFEYMSWTPKLEGFVNKKPKENIDEELTCLGLQRWELVSIITTTANMGTSFGGTTGAIIYYFKREKEI